MSVPPYNPAQNARSHVTLTGCTDEGASGWSAKGEVTNATTASHGVSIAIDFETSGATVVDTKLVNVPKLAPNTSKSWSVSGGAPGQKGLTCVIRQALYT